MMKGDTPGIDWRKEWDAEIGLWRQDGGGHSPAVKDLAHVHSGRTAAARLILAAEMGELSRVDVSAVLGALRRLQVESGPFEGCFKWYWEEREPYDTNAAFFIGLPLLVLWKAFRHDLDGASQSILEGVLRRLDAWFTRALGMKEFFAPNGFLGELVCAWLLTEVLEKRDTRPVQDVMLRAADYLLRNEWGWGEHLSDGYTMVCLDQLSVLLLVSERLPRRIRRRYERLFHELMSIEDRFDNGPRVPAIRSYSGSSSPTHANYREKIVPAAALSEEAALAALARYTSFDALLYQRGWHRLAGPRAPKAHGVRIRCYGGAMATARLEPDIRVGSMSRYPIMPGTEHREWGLSWQSFPVAFWRPEGDWAFLQWEAEENGRLRSHPAPGYGTAYLDNALTVAMVPPVVGHTFAIQRGGNVLALRVMPAVPRSWSRLTDRLRLVDGHARMSESPGGRTAPGPWSRLLLEYDGRSVGIACLALTSGSAPALVTRQGSADWELSFGQAELALAEVVVTLWGISLDGPVTHAPLLREDAATHLVPRQPSTRAWHLNWEWPGVSWSVHIDPLLPTALEPIRGRRVTNDK